MARSTRPSSRAPSSGRMARLVVLVVALPLLAAVPATAASGQEAAPAPSLGAVLDGGVDGLTATATSAFGGFEPGRPSMEVTIELTNDGAAPTAVAVPFGLLLATDQESDQTVAVSGPTDDPTVIDVAASGGTPELAAPPGTSTHMLTVHCAEMDDGAPFEPTPMHHAGTAAEPLPTVLRAIAAQQPDDATAQDAVWWVTDQPTLPVPTHIAPLLADVDTEAFAAAPHGVVPDSAYVPTWSRAGVVDEAFDGGTQADATPLPSSAGPGPLLWILLATGAFALALVVVARRSSAAPTPAPARPAGPGAPGWYPDPWVRGGLRWWDGRTWTSRVGPGR